MQLESEILFGKFDWTNWGVTFEQQVVSVKEAIAQFEEYYWESRPKTPTKLESFKNDYTSIFDKIPDQSFSEDMLKDFLLTFPADSRARVRAYTALRAMGKWANFELKDWSRLKGNYEADNSRLIPTDDQIIATLDKMTDDWRWVYGIMAAYGLRNHEVFFVDLSEMPIVRVLPTTKTKERLVFPLHNEWSDLFNVSEMKVPPVDITRTNKKIGGSVSSCFKRLKVGFTPYALRDAYAVRAAVLGIDSAIVARWMGHSLTVHHKHYQKYINKEADKLIWENNGKKNSKP